MIDHPLETVDIRHIHLINQQEIIAYINSIKGTIIITERPMLINCIHSNEGDTYYFSNYMPFSKNNLVKINSKNIIAISEVRNDIKEKYIQSILIINNNDLYSSQRYKSKETQLDHIEMPSKEIH